LEGRPHWLRCGEGVSVAAESLMDLSSAKRAGCGPMDEGARQPGPGAAAWELGGSQETLEATPPAVPSDPPLSGSCPHAGAP
jgi:hypothetical protein